MKHYLTAVFLSVSLISSAYAHDYKVGALEIGHPWTRPSSANIAGGFLKVTNKGTFENADKVEIHETTMENNVAKMRPGAGGITIKPGETVELKPGSFQGTLVFEKAGTVPVEYRVERRAAHDQKFSH